MAKAMSLDINKNINFSDELQRLRETKVGDLVSEKKRLVEVPYTATLAHTLNALVANNVVAVPVAAPPGHWIGAGGSMILESDKHTGAVRKHYIGMLTMFDILAHIAEDDQTDGGDGLDMDKRMSVPVCTIIGHSLEGLSLWTLNPNTSILDCMEVFSKGIHRALVPLDSHMENISGVELAESSSSYRMLTQMDVLTFLRAHGSELKNVLSHTVGELGAITEHVFGVTNRTKVIDAVKCMRTGSLHAVPIIEAFDATEEDHKQLINGKGRKLVGTFSATDLKGCPIDLLPSWMYIDVLEFTNRVSTGAVNAAGDMGTHSSRTLVTCDTETSLAEVIDKAVTGHVHRVWVVDKQGLLDGIVALTDMLRVIRISLLHGTEEL
ncbi:CBS domain [Macleaya cordata]|uniref:CBS domain n=1 Tax=Macleaya cordata TaxID=56857 RepID=A0A200PNT2_MACCD|nr:CBS domain [Macleaya cordata]